MIRPLDISCAASRSPTRAGPIRWFRSRGPAWLRALSLLASLHGLAHGQALPAQPLPSSAELEAAGATIGEIRFIPQDIFDTRDPKEDKWLFRWANALHIQTRPGVIERALAALPIPWLIYASQDWGWIVLATLLLGVNQGLTWSMTQTAKLDIARQDQRGLAIGLNEFAGYVGLALAGVLTGYTASHFGTRLGLLVFGMAAFFSANIDLKTLSAMGGFLKRLQVGIRTHGVLLVSSIRNP